MDARSGGHTGTPAEAARLELGARKRFRFAYETRTADNASCASGPARSLPMVIHPGSWSAGTPRQSGASWPGAHARTDAGASGTGVSSRIPHHAPIRSQRHQLKQRRRRRARHQLGASTLSATEQPFRAAPTAEPTGLGRRHIEADTCALAADQPQSLSVIGTPGRRVPYRRPGVISCGAPAGVRFAASRAAIQ